MAKKQIAFRLEEHIYQKFQEYLQERNHSLQDVLEEAVMRMLAGKDLLKLPLKEALKNIFENDLEKVKGALYEAFSKSIVLTPSRFSVFLVVNELGDIQVLEGPDGWLPSDVKEQKAYLLWEFPSFHLVDLYDLYDEYRNREPVFLQDAVQELGYEEFAEWLVDNDYEQGEDSWGIIQDASCRDRKQFIDLVYKWDLKYYKKFRDLLLKELEETEYAVGDYYYKVYENGTTEFVDQKKYRNLKEFHILIVLEKILAKEEMNFISRNFTMDYGPVDPHPLDEETRLLIQKAFWSGVNKESERSS